MDFETLHTYPISLGLPKHLKSTWLRDLCALPSHYLVKPTTGEKFEDKEQCYRRLNTLAKLKGFAVVVGDNKTGKEIITPR